jgi:hypothetical protein
MKYIATVTTICLLMVVFIFGLTAGVGSAATIELARGRDGKALVGLKVEGEIVPGDAIKLLGMYQYYGNGAASTIFLLSKGGDVEEAMTMGRLIRTLRLETVAPSDIQLPVPMGVVTPANKDNFICASACFLIYSGGVSRIGDFLVLHRPFFSKNAARNMSDVEQAAAQKQLMAKVRYYLQTMEVDHYYIDKLMSTNSQDGYAVTGNDLVAHPLDIIVPSIEEIILTKCDIVTTRQMDEARKDTTLEGRDKWTKLSEQWVAGMNCKEKQLDSLRAAAWDREHSHVLAEKCKSLGLGPQESQALIDWFKTPQDARAKSTIEEQQVILQIFSKQDALKNCQADALLDLSLTAITRWRNAPPGASLPPDAGANPFELIELEQRQ